MRLIILAAQYTRTHALPALVAISVVARLISLLSVDSSQLAHEDQIKAEKVTGALQRLSRAVLLVVEAVQVFSEVLGGVRRPLINTPQ